MQWFSNNQMKANAVKWYFSTNSNEEPTIYIDNNITKIVTVGNYLVEN